MSWLQWLRKYNPETGRYIRENGEYFNVADGMKRADDTNFLLSVEDGEIYSAFFSYVMAPAEILYFTQPIADVGGALRGIRFGGVFESGPILYRQYVGGTAGTTLDTLTGHNADRRQSNSTHPIIRVDSYTPGTLIDESFGNAPSATAQRATAALTGAGIGGIYDSTVEPVFVLENEGTGNARIALSWVWKERGDL